MGLLAIEPELSRANLALGRLDGVADLVPNPDLFVAMYVRKEAVLSSRIEGTQASLDDVLAYEAGVPAEDDEPADVEEVFNYVRALNHGLARLPDLPLSLRLLREVHAILLEDVRGGDKTSGAFRKSQNWIGPSGCTLAGAIFVPPAPLDMIEPLADLEAFARRRDEMPTLVRCAIAHQQFETIHPFLDGNGRLGRLLVTLMLSEREVLSRPLLYLSSYFTRNKNEYYAWLARVREEGDWEGWIRFFLEGVRAVAAEAVTTARAVLELQQRHRDIVRAKYGNVTNALALLDSLALHPIVTVKHVAKSISTSVPTANSLVSDFERLGLLREITGRKRGRVFRYQTYLDALSPAER